MSDVHPLDLAQAANGIRNAVEAVADNAVDALDTRCSEDFRKLISYGFCHLGLPRGKRDKDGGLLARCDGGVARWQVGDLGTRSRGPTSSESPALCSPGQVNYC